MNIEASSSLTYNREIPRAIVTRAVCVDKIMNVLIVILHLKDGKFISVLLVYALYLDTDIEVRKGI